MTSDALLNLVKDGATAEPWGNKGIHIKVGDKDLWTDHTVQGIEIWTTSVGGATSSRAIVGLNMIDA